MLVALLAGFAHAESVTVYSARNEQLIKPLFDAFTKETGIDIKLLTDKEGPLMERLKAEGKNSPADILITVDAGNLWQAASMGLLQPTRSAVLDANVPAHLRDPQGQWFGLSQRVRTLFYNPAAVKPGELSTYEDLANPKWKGKLCLRTSKKVYNQSLVAVLIAQHGEAKTEQIVRGWVANLATDVFADDTKMLEAIAAGQCAVGIANSYYYGRIVDKKPDFPVKIFWANQQAGGVHVNVSGAGVTRFAKNQKGAVRLIEWLSSDKAQNLYATKDFEYPVNPHIKPDGLVASWGAFKPNPINVAKAGELQAKATQLMDRAGYK
ncbi:Fe(3+) ABC transporter substrate-binding protein [Chitiniphilus eburneus]|uniref:Fe(3+) ABC transporter substrate-binding protein n=1 Tax=Chitiniphilus eburneus TaxID=2571148 RepID=A0A4U0PDE7_9NEIS|nr:Fe(3+) ABC transporter substrate-binding protein [Chitiniphilus eburneus]